MVTDTARLRAAVFEQTGIAIDDKDPIVAVIAAFSHQSEEMTQRLLRRTSAVRAVLASAAVALVFSGVASWITWEIARSRSRAEQTEWLRKQGDPRFQLLLKSEEGRAGLRLAELGVASMLERCNGRRSWRLTAGYCVPATPDGKPDGFKVRDR